MTPVSNFQQFLESNSKQPDYKDALLSLSRKLEGTVRKLDRVMDQVLEASPNQEKSDWIEKSQRLQQEKREIEQQIDTLNKRLENRSELLLDAKAIQGALAQFGANFDQLPIAAKQAFLKSILDKIEVKKDEIVLHIKNPGFTLGPETPIPRTCGPGDQFLVYRSNWGLWAIDNIKTKSP